MTHSSALMKKVRYGYAFGHNKATKRDAASCASGGFYTAPTASQTVKAGDPFTISWDPTCLDTQSADIYLYSQEAANPRIHLWQNVNFALGTYQTTLEGAWWNSTASVSLQLAIVNHGLPPFMATLPAGPIFTATADSSAPSAPANANVGAIENVNNFANSNHLSKGKIAAAVIMPILVVVGIFVGMYIWKQRKQGKKSRSAWSEAVDKRMSTISADWKSITPAGASAAVRSSMAPGDRASSFSFGAGAIRPISTMATEGGHAGIGAAGMHSGGIDVTTPQMTQLRAGLRNPSTITGERVSRVSFAPDTRPSGESRRSLANPRTSRFQTSIVPPLPERQDSGDMSPTQTNGPLTLTAEDIKSRMNGQENLPRPSVDEVMPALSMMRTGEHNINTGNDELLFTPPSPPAPAHQSAPKSVVGMMPMQPMPANVMSPDDMLRAYAEQRRTGLASPPPMNGVSVPAPVANYNGNGMRVLYSPTSTDSATIAASPYSAARKSLAPTIASKYDDDDAYGGTA
ncbi:hypothetical protein EIP91_004204 [Steccherinum ochraceum]|uniref:Uncharacterized protein n=1 Tax=Steccherinum ochraceum TaxID=92696 RepID=A0A4R0RCE1_9APHY|nr:hypothetical protein EIP91_004204 [Steccherinum ochraceum]